jgi:hypothetical protein
MGCSEFNNGELYHPAGSRFAFEEDGRILACFRFVESGLNLFEGLGLGLGLGFGSALLGSGRWSRFQC